MRRSLRLLILWLSLLLGCANVIRVGDPLWKISIVSKNDCNSIDGRYLDKGLLAAALKDSSVKTHTTKFSTSEGFIQKPYIGLPSIEFGAVQRKFNETSFVRIKKISMNWEISLFGGDGKEYERSTIISAHENVGCDRNGRLVLRKFSIFTGSEGTGGSASAAEIIVSRSSDGGLEILRLDRTWNKSMDVPPTKESSQIMKFPVAP